MAHTEEVADEYLKAQGVWKETVPLGERVDRKGDGRWRAENAGMRYDDEEGCWRFWLDYTSEQLEIDNPALVVGIHRSGVPGDCALVLDSRCMGGLPSRIPGKGRIQVLLSRDAFFAPGQYFCDVICMVAGDVVGNFAFTDQVKAAFAFNVGSGWSLTGNGCRSPAPLCTFVIRGLSGDGHEGACIRHHTGVQRRQNRAGESGVPAGADAS